MSKSIDTLQTFIDGKDLYSEMVSKMFGIKVAKDNENASYRKYGKIVTLTYGYEGSVGSLKAFGATALGIKETELSGIVTSWRNANPNVVKMWWDIDKAIKNVIKLNETYKGYGLTLSKNKGNLLRSII